jgi:hypothetical protein
MRTLPIPISNTLYCNEYTNSVAGVDACFVKEYSIAVQAHPTPSGLLTARYQYLLMIFQ